MWLCFFNILKLHSCIVMPCHVGPPLILQVLVSTAEKSTNGSSFLVSSSWLLQYRCGPLEASGMDLVVVLLLR